MKPVTKARLMSAVMTIGKLRDYENWDEGVIIVLLTLIKEQDRDTRHACAEAILSLPHDMTHTDAQRAVMNVRAV